MPISIKQGSAIPSPNVVAGRNYVDGRSIENLKQVGAVTADEAELLSRVDQIIASRPPDGRPAIDEMLRLEQPDFKATLFPNEQAIQPGLWKQLEWETGAPRVTAPTLPTLQSQIADQSVSPGAVNRSLPMPISDLPAALQRTARRVELVLNSDADASTITLVDLDQSVAAPGRFLPQEAEDFLKIQAELLKRQPSTPKAVVTVPMPGASQASFAAGSLAFALKQQTSLTESRSIYDRSGGFYVQIDAHRTSSLELTIPAGSKAIFINTDSGQETLLEAGTHKLDGMAGNFRTELWRGGARAEVNDVTLPALQNESVSLSQYADHELQANGVALAKRLVRAGTSYTGSEQTYSAQFTYDPAATFPPPDAGQVNIAKVLDTPAISLLPGRYRIALPSLGAVTLDLYPQGVVKAEYDGQPLRLQNSKISGGSGSYNKGWQTPSDPFVYFDPQANTVKVSTRGKYEEATVKAEFRVG